MIEIYTVLEKMIIITLLLNLTFSIVLTIYLYELLSLVLKNPKLAMIIIFNKGKEFFKAISITAFATALFNITGLTLSRFLFPVDERMMYLFYSFLSVFSGLFLILPILRTRELNKVLKETIEAK